MAHLTGLPGKTALLVATASVVLGLLLFTLKDREFRSNGEQVIGGTILGLLVSAGWYLTGHVGFGENPDTLEMTYFATNTRTIEPFTFVATVAYSLKLLMLWTDKSLRLTFGIASVAGIFVGSLAHALISHEFRWEGFASLEDLRNHLIGATLMGFGGVLAMGCTVGQGLSGVSTLAVGSFIALAGIIAGSAATMKWLQR